MPPRSDSAHSPSIDPSLRTELERNNRFRRDSLLGGILHLGKVSYREMAATDSVHITLDGNRISVHVDDVSPVKARPDGRGRYSGARIVAHNLIGICRDITRRLQGHRGHQRCNLDCEVIWVDDETAEVNCEESECPTSSGEKMPPMPAVGRAPQ